MSLTVKIILDTRRIKMRTEKFPVKLRIIECGRTRDFQTIYDLSKGEFESFSAKKIKGNLQTIGENLREIERHATHAAKQIMSFDIADFERDFVYENQYFRPRKLKVKVVGKSAVEFDYSPYFGRFPLFSEDHSRPGCISRSYLAYIKKCCRRIGLAMH